MNLLLRIAVVFAIFTDVSLANAKNHVAKKGDTLAKIARSYYGEPVFGAKGTIQKIYALNPWAKKAGSALEPGQVVVLEDESPTQLPSKTPVVITPVPLPGPIPAEKSEAAEGPTETEKTAAPPIVEAPKCPEPIVCPACPVVSPLPVPSLVACPTPPPIPESKAPRGVFLVAPNYLLVKETGTDASSGAAYSIQSSQAYGVEVAWDHWWNESVSTVVRYSVAQMTSNEKSDVSGASVVDNVILSRGELTLFNRASDFMRIGFGVTYGEHIFLEQFTSVPNDPKIFRASIWNPFVATEFHLLDRKSFDFLLGLKIGGLPAQVGQGHDLSSGTEFVGNLNLVQKFEAWSLLYGVDYSTSDQTRTNANQKYEAWTFKIGAIF